MEYNMPFLLNIFTFNDLHGKSHINPYNSTPYCVACVVHKERLGCLCIIKHGPTTEHVLSSDTITKKSFSKIAQNVRGSEMNSRVSII